MSNSDQNASHEVEQGEEKVDERLSKLSLIARNVTLRLSTTTTRRTVSKKVAGKTNAKEPLENGKKIGNAKTVNKIRNTDLRSTNVDLTGKESEPSGNKSYCSESSTKFKKEAKSLPNVETSNSSLHFFTEQLSATEEAGEQSEQFGKIEVMNDQVECSDCKKRAELTANNCGKRLPDAQTNNTRTSPLTEGQIPERNSPKKSNETTKKCISPKQATPSRKNPGQTSSAKLRIPLGTIRRRKSMKLGDRSLVRRKSFLKKGDGLAAQRQLTKQMKTGDTGVGEMMGNSSNEKQINSREKTFLRMPGRKDKTNSTFLLTRHKKLPSMMTACESSEVAKSSSRSRRQWSENSVQTYEAMIFSSVFAFSEELRESSDIIHSKLQALYDSTHKTNNVFTKKSSGLTKEWRQNNRELLNSGSQEIAGIFSNLRKVESNLKTVDQAVSILLKEKPRSKERLTGSHAKSKDCQIVQKGIK